MATTTNLDAEAKDLADSIRNSSEQAPSSQLQTDSYKFYRESINRLGSPYDVTHIPISVLEQMQRDPTIAFALHFIKTPIMRASWHIQSEDAQVAAFVDNALRPVMPRFIGQYGQSWSFGFSPLVKRHKLEKPDWKYFDPSKSDIEVPVWDEGSIEAITLDNFVPLKADPSVTEPHFNAAGEFAGIKYSPPEGYHSRGFPWGTQTTDNQPTIDLAHALWITNERDSVNGSLWGFPRIGYAYRYWWSYWFRWALYDRYFERKADPPYVVNYPLGSDGEYIEVDGQKISLRQIALSIGDAAKSGGTIAMPSKVYSGYDDRPSSAKEWEIKELEIQGDLSNFVESFEYLDKSKLRAMLIPEQALAEGSGGTSSRNVAGEEIEIFKEAEASEAESIDNILNKFVIPDLIKANFPERNVTARKVTTGFSEADSQQMQEVVRMLAQSDPGALQEIDLREIYERLGFPLVSRAELKRREEETMKALEESTPTPIAPIDGKQAGVTQTGLYVQGRRQLNLDETYLADDDSEFVASLKSDHYSDGTILKQARTFRKAWKKNYKKVYDDFASYLADLKETELAEDSSSKKAESIVDKWSPPTDFLDDSKETLKKVISRAGILELRNANIESDWNLDTESVTNWIEDRGLEMAKAIEDTTRQELKDFLSNQIKLGKSNEEIADEVKSHFSESFPDWKAERITRSEIRNSYNFATIAAGEQKGVKVVQAKDAQGDGETDETCIDRNGKFFTVKQAYKEITKEHPNGTLSFSLTDKKTRPKTELVEELDPSYGEDAIAAYNVENNTIYFTEEMTDEQKSNYMLELGEYFVY